MSDGTNNESGVKTIRDVWDDFIPSANPDWFDIFKLPNGAPQLAEILSNEFDAYRVAEIGSEERKIWEGIGALYRVSNHWQSAIVIYSYMYTHFINAQIKTQKRISKGMPLVWLAESYYNLGNQYLSKRYLMLTLIEDAIQQKGIANPKELGSYFRLVWHHWMSDVEFNRYFKEAYEIYTSHPIEALFPEYVLQELDKYWMVEIPSPNDVGLFVINNLYVEYLLKQLGDETGLVLERLADYLLSCVPGCKTARRKRTHSTDYDIVCSVEGPAVDFRSEFGRYFICECKDRGDPANFTTIAKFIRVLDSIKARFGIIFSSKGLTGASKTKYAERELLKAYQDRGVVIIVITLEDLRQIASSGNFISLLRERYEKMRLDLT
jgi:hypothetical protein